MGNGQSVSDETFGDEGRFRVHIKLHAGFSTAERLKLRDACRAWVNVWHSPSFKKWMMEFNFSDTDHTNKEIYDKLLGGLSGANVIDNQADIEIWGRRDPETDGTLVSTTFVHNGAPWEGSTRLLTDSAAKVAWQLVYDYCRHQGFLHAGYSEEQSVPSAVAKQTQILIEVSEALSGPLTGLTADVMGMTPEVAQEVAPYAAPLPLAASHESKEKHTEAQPKPEKHTEAKTKFKQSKEESKGVAPVAAGKTTSKEPAEAKHPVNNVVPFAGSSKDQGKPPAKDAAESKLAVVPAAAASVGGEVKSEGEPPAQDVAESHLGKIVVPASAASVGDEVKSEEWVEVEDDRQDKTNMVLPEMRAAADPASVPKDAYELEQRKDESEHLDNRTYAEVVSSKAPAISQKMGSAQENAENDENFGGDKENQPNRPSLPHQPLSGSKELADFIRNEINFHFDMKEVI